MEEEISDKIYSALSEYIFIHNYRNIPNAKYEQADFEMNFSKDEALKLAVLIVKKEIDSKQICDNEKDL